MFLWKLAWNLMISAFQSWKSVEIRRLRRLMSEHFTFVCSHGKIRMNLPIFIRDIFIFQFSNKLHTHLKFDSEFSPEKLATVSPNRKGSSSNHHFSGAFAVKLQGFQQKNILFVLTFHVWNPHMAPEAMGNQPRSSTGDFSRQDSVPRWIEGMRQRILPHKVAGGFWGPMILWMSSEIRRENQLSLVVHPTTPLKINMEPQKWRFGRWFSFSIGWFLGSMLIFRGVFTGFLHPKGGRNPCGFLVAINRISHWPPFGDGRVFFFSPSEISPTSHQLSASGGIWRRGGTAR